MENDQASVDGLAGVRYWSVDSKLTLRGGPAGSYAIDNSEDWFDPIVGFKGLTMLSNSKLFLSGALIIGGFGAGSDFLWDVNANIGCQWGDMFSTTIGYRYLDVDFENDGFLYDVAQHGPTLGLSWRFWRIIADDAAHINTFLRNEMKKLLIGLIGLLAIAGIALFLLVGNLDKIIKGSLESIGSELLGVPVTVSSVTLDLKQGTGQISGFYIANPIGYQAENAFEMDMIRLGLNLGSLGKQPLVINELDISSPAVELEVKPDGSSNLKTLLDNIEKNRDQANRKAAEEQPDVEGAEKGEPIRISFQRLAITGVNVNAVIPGQDPVKVVIPDIVKTNVGGDTGLTPAEVGGVILGEIIGKSLQASLEKKLTERIEQATKGLLNDIKNKLTPGKSN